MTQLLGPESICGRARGKARACGLVHRGLCGGWLGSAASRNDTPGQGARRHRQKGTDPMRAMLLSVASLAIAAVTASFAAPAKAQGLETGGISITRGGGNVNAPRASSPRPIRRSPRWAASPAAVAGRSPTAATTATSRRARTASPGRTSPPSAGSPRAAAAPSPRAATTSTGHAASAAPRCSRSPPRADRLRPWPVADPRRLQLQPRGRASSPRPTSRC